MKQLLVRRQWGYRELDPGDYSVGEWREVIMDPLADLLELCATVEGSAARALDEIDGGPQGGYGPRLWLTYRRKKAIAQELRHMLAEADLIRSTTARLP